MAWKDYLPNLKESLKGFYEENLRDTLEAKTNQFKLLLERNLTEGKKTQQALLAVALGIFFLLLIAYFWK